MMLLFHRSVDGNSSCTTHIKHFCNQQPFFVNGYRLNNKLMRSIQAVISYFLLLANFSCRTYDVEEANQMVPATADADPLLPQLRINVAGHDRAIHLQTFGSPQSPAVFAIPGGPGADYKLLLPLKALADSFFVVLWDPRGAGLSERVERSELTIESSVAEIQAVKDKLSITGKLRLVGHSFGANVMARYADQHKDLVERLVLIEPAMLNKSSDVDYNGGSVSFLDGHVFFWSNELLTSSDHASADYKAIDLLPKASRNFTCDGSIPDPYPMWRFGSFHYHIIQKHVRSLPKDFRWAPELSNAQFPISVICGSCGAAGETYQRRATLPEIPTARFAVIQNAGHISLFTNMSTELLHELRNALR